MIGRARLRYVFMMSCVILCASSSYNAIPVGNSCSSKCEFETRLTSVSAQIDVSISAYIGGDDMIHRTSQ
jgi:hypothetical protein